MPAFSCRWPLHLLAPWGSDMSEATTLGMLEKEVADAIAPPPETAKSVAELIAATSGGSNAAFDFQHKVFAIPGARFGIDRRARSAMFYMHLGNLDVSLTPTVLRREFRIESDSHDSQLIELATKALRHVKEVRPGDSIPMELIDGTASWTVEERHRQLAKGRLLVQLAKWFTKGVGDASIESILALSEHDVAAKEELQSAFGAVARSLGLDPSRKQEIIDRIDMMARELCYIEALRDHAAQLRTIRERIMQLACAAKGDKILIEELTRILTLLKAPLAEFADRFVQIDARTGDLLALLRNPWIEIKFIRDERDAIHSSLLPWSEIFDRWRDQEIILNHDTHENVHALHHWLAANYAPSKVWR